MQQTAIDVARVAAVRDRLLRRRDCLTPSYADVDFLLDQVDRLMRRIASGEQHVDALSREIFRLRYAHEPVNYLYRSEAQKQAKVWLQESTDQVVIVATADPLPKPYVFKCGNCGVLWGGDAIGRCLVCYPLDQSEPVSALLDGTAQYQHPRPICINLDALIEKARGHVMTPEEIAAQRRSWVYGNCSLDNPAITREMVNAADVKVALDVAQCAPLAGYAETAFHWLRNGKTFLGPIQFSRGLWQFSNAETPPDVLARAGWRWDSLVGSFRVAELPLGWMPDAPPLQKPEIPPMQTVSKGGLW